MSFLNPGEISDLDIGLILVAFAALVNFLVGRIAIRKGTKNRSPALVASGKHLCSDTVSSVGILIVLFVVYIAMALGYDARWLDSSSHHLRLIILVTGRSDEGCMDESWTRPTRKVLDVITEAINEYRHDDWIDVYHLRMIKHGPKIYIDMHVVFPRKMTVQDIADEVDELDEAVAARYGDAIEISVNPVPCCEFNCRNCCRNCFDRDGDFERRVVWTSAIALLRQAHWPSTRGS